MCVSHPKSQLGVIASTYWLQFTWMYGTPACASRRASRHDCPNDVCP